MNKKFLLTIAFLFLLLAAGFFLIVNFVFLGDQNLPNKEAVPAVKN